MVGSEGLVDVMSPSRAGSSVDIELEARIGRALLVTSLGQLEPIISEKLESREKLVMVREAQSLVIYVRTYPSLFILDINSAYIPTYGRIYFSV